MDDEYIEYEIVESVEYNTCSLQTERLPVGTRFFGTREARNIGREGLCIDFRKKGNPTDNFYIPLRYLKEARAIYIGGE